MIADTNHGIWNILLADRIVNSNSLHRSKKLQYSNEIKHFINCPRKSFIPESMELRLDVIFVMIADTDNGNCTINKQCHIVHHNNIAPPAVCTKKICMQMQERVGGTPPL